MAPVVQEEFKVCRVCLALDVKMYIMNDFKLSEMFQNITGITAIDKKGSILQRVCWECAARLTAAAAFREKALLSDALLKNRVHIKQSDIALLKQNYSSLKSPLSVVTSYYIECERTLSENKKALKERKTKKIMNEKDIELEEYEPWIDVPVKTEVESDPFFEQSNDASLREDSEVKMTNTEVQINNNDTILGDTENKVPYINDYNINFEEDNDTVDKIPKLDGLSNRVYEDSSEEGGHSEEASFNKFKQNMSSKVGIEEDNGTLDKISKLDGLSSSVYEDSSEEDRHSEEASFNKYKQNRSSKVGFEEDNETVDKIPKLDGLSSSDEDSSEEDIHSEEASFNKYKQNRSRKVWFEEDDETVDKIPKLDGLSSSVYEDSSEEDRHSEEASFNKYKQNRSSKVGIKKKRESFSKHLSLHEDLKEQIIALKQDGTSNSRVAFLLDTTRFTVRKWWNRWCKEGHLNKHKITKKKRKTTALEDQLLINRVVQEQTVHTPSLAREFGISTHCVRRRLKEAGFKPQERKASVPLRSGRNHKVDDVTKQQIITMKNNGVSVTEIANQFRVTRTSVYLWWRRWCKEINTKVTHNTIESDKRKQPKKKSGNLKKSAAVNSVYTLRKRS